MCRDHDQATSTHDPYGRHDRPAGELHRGQQFESRLVEHLPARWCEVVVGHDTGYLSKQNVALLRRRVDVAVKVGPGRSAHRLRVPTGARRLRAGDLSLIHISEPTRLGMIS